MATPGAAFAPRRALLAGAAAVALGVTAFAAHDAQAAFTLARCQGSPSVRAQGASFQNGAHAYWKQIFESSNGCDGTPAAPEYRSNGSGNGIASMGGGGGSNLLCADAGQCPTTGIAAGVRDPLSSLSATDEPPSPQQISDMNRGTDSASDDGRIHLIPVATGASAFIMHAPEGCTLSTVSNLTNGAAGALADTGDSAANKTQRIRLTNALVEKAFAGATDADTWGEIAPGISGTAQGVSGGDQTNAGVPCADVPVRRIVRQDVSGTTYGWKAFLNLINPTRGWLSPAYAANNRIWPGAGGNAPGTAVVGQGASCPTTGDKLCTAASSGGGNLAGAVAATDGSIGYVDLVTARSRSFDVTPDASRQDYTFWAPLENNPGGVATGYAEPTLDARAHSGSIGAKGSNCQTVPVTGAPTPANSPNGDPTLGDWSSTYAAGGSSYGACVLTYLLAWDDNAAVYGASATEEAKARTVKDYLATIVGPGQGFNNVDYSPLPNSARTPLLQYAQGAVAAIDWNKTSGSSTEREPETRQPETRQPETRQPETRTPPSNAFSIPSGRATASLITYVVQLPGAGTLKVNATAKVGKKTVKVSSLSAKPSKAGRFTLRLKLSAAAKQALKKAKGKKLAVTVKFTYTPTGGTAKSQTKKITVKAAKARAKQKAAKR
jgi:ABC-type phosphate transport system substrate-binding protein